MTCLQKWSGFPFHSCFFTGVISLARVFKSEEKNKDAAASIEARYRTLFNQSPDGVLLLNTKGDIIDFNEAVNRQLGHTREEFTKLHLTDIEAVESPGDIKSHYDVVTREGKAEFEVKHRTKSGEFRDVQVIIQTIVLAGQTYYHTIWRDVTERKRFVETLRSSEEKFHTLFESANDAIFILSLEGRFVDINRTGYERLGYTKEEMLTKRYI